MYDRYDEKSKSSPLPIAQQWLIEFLAIACKHLIAKFNMTAGTTRVRGPHGPLQAKTLLELGLTDRSR